VHRAPRATGTRHGRNKRLPPSSHGSHDPIGRRSPGERHGPVQTREPPGHRLGRLYLPPVTFPYGAAHESELQYLFDLPTAPATATLTAKQQKLATSMQRYWASFAAQGFPSSLGQPPWPAFSRGSERMISLLPPRPQVETDFAGVHHCAFWASAG
jgi:para-nitrobenzyl esterase